MDIKDYLHLYLGCDVQYPDTDGKLMVAKFTGFSRADGIETTYKKKPKKGDAIGDYLSWKDNGYHKSDALNLKPILRPLSDITEEEAKVMCRFQIKGMRDCDHVKIIQMKPVVKFIIFTEGEGTDGRIERFLNIEKYEVQQFKYLLENGFDIFGLIDAGLAIDKTKL